MPWGCVGPSECGLGSGASECALSEDGRVSMAEGTEAVTGGEGDASDFAEGGKEG